MGAAAGQPLFESQGCGAVRFEAFAGASREGGIFGEARVLFAAFAQPKLAVFCGAKGPRMAAEGA